MVRISPQATDLQRLKGGKHPGGQNPLTATNYRILLKLLTLFVPNFRPACISMGYGALPGRLEMKRILSRFAKKEDGNATVEFVLWLPLIAGIIVGALDLNMISLTQSNMWTVARDTVRRISTGELNASTGQDYALARLSFLDYTCEVDVTVGTDAVVDISASLTDMAVVGVIGGKQSYAINASVTMRVEQE